jgi:hypothetical protein
MPKSVTDKSDFRSRGILHETPPPFGAGARHDPVPVEKNAPTIPGHSLTSVVITHGT